MNGVKDRIPCVCSAFLPFLEISASGKRKDEIPKLLSVLCAARDPK